MSAISSFYFFQVYIFYTCHHLSHTSIHCCATSACLSNKGYDGAKADLWSCGVILYVLMAVIVLRQCHPVPEIQGFLLLRTGFPRHPAPVYQWHLSCQKLQLLEAEERERAFTGRGRWNQVRSLAEAKTIMIFLFNLASSTRCSLWDKEVSCREKDSEVRDLKEKVVHLVQQLELQKAEY
ncbi:hypothetical protein POM88_022769 [Heracleum sosnowskyi]|uniref:Protein kinase domain-containing protein n=1 Tax=Heracleum sosnowskyi TaxID=360622 RepID=A0AAD8IHC9_9APIA|nr:hypothetical protein POM88_022769 [Heracleum sosnowskyi]